MVDGNAMLAIISDQSLIADQSNRIHLNLVRNSTRIEVNQFEYKNMQILMKGWVNEYF